MKKQLNKNHTKSNTVNEPTTPYANKKITFFASLQEENEYTRKQYASMTPEERLGAVTHMRLAANPSLNTNLHPWGSTVYFD